MFRPLSLALEDKALLPEPLLAIALYDFEGEIEMAELSFTKGQMLRIFCEDFGASWSLAMLVDAQGDELAIDENEGGSPRVTRGLVAQGFYEYVSEPSTAPTSIERHQTSTGSRDGNYEQGLSSPTDTIVLRAATASQSAKDEHRGEESTSDANDQESVARSDDPTLDISADYLNESLVESPIVVLQTDQVPDTAPVPPAQHSLLTEFNAHDLPTEAVSHTVDTADTARHKQIPPVPVPASHVAVRAQQAPTSLLKPRNLVEAYLNSDLPFEPEDGLEARDIIEIEDGKWIARIPAFLVAVPLYSQRRVTGGRGEYTVFQVVSSISLPARHSQAETCNVTELSDVDQTSSVEQSELRQITVDRRYTHFQHLHTILKASLPLLIIPDLPEKRLTGNFNTDFLNTRRRDLGRYLSRLARHKLVRSNKAFLDFLGCENEEIYDANLPRMLMQALRSDPERFFTRIKHDSDHFDEHQLLEDVTEEQDRMARHVRAVEKGQATAATFNGLSHYRERLQSTGSALSDIALSLTSLVSGLAQPKGDPVITSEGAPPESADRTRRRREKAKAHNMQNDEGAFCWREICPECLATTKAVQEAAEAIYLVADLYDANARTVLLGPQNQLMEYSLPHQRYQSLLSSVKLAQTYLAELLVTCEHADTPGDPGAEERKKRAEVVLNSLLAEIDQIHDERREDLQKLAVTLFNGQIAFHERALIKLRSARSFFEPEQLEELAQQGPRLPSILEKAIISGPKASVPLPKASSFGLPAAPQSAGLRPITNLVSTLFSGAVGLSGSWRSAISAIKAQSPASLTSHPEHLRERLGGPSLASASRLAQFLDWTLNSRGEERQYA